MPEKKEMTTNLSLPVTMRQQIIRHAKAEGRTYKPQIKVLLAEALAARKEAK